MPKAHSNRPEYDHRERQEEFCRLFTYPLIRHSDMNDDMKRDTLQTCVTAVDKYSDNNQTAAQRIKEDMDRRYGPSWHVVVGEQFGFEISHEIGSLLYVFCGGSFAVCVWKCN